MADKCKHCGELEKQEKLMPNLSVLVTRHKIGCKVDNKSSNNLNNENDSKQNLTNENGAL